MSGTEYPAGLITLHASDSASDMLPAASTPNLPGHLADNVLHFARVLRDAGLPVGTDRVQLSLQALAAGALQSRRDFKAALAACLIDRAEHRALFDQAFELFWRDPDLLGRMMAMLLPKVSARDGGAPPAPQRENRRLADALFPPGSAPPPAMAAPPPDEVEIHAPFSASEREVLRHRDFETLTAAEWQQAKRLVARMGAFMPPLPTRRHAPDARPGRVDWRATLAAMARHGGDLPTIRWQRPREQPAPLVVLADISGSMSNYSRMLLHFAHALAQSDLRITSFVFGTRLTPITRSLRQRDPDIAIAHVTRQVKDWSGGTRISDSLHEFNRHWARRALGGGRATVLLVTDGLERGDTTQLAFETERLAKSCRRLVWLNPLLRYAGFEAKAGGIRAMRPHVDLFLPAHNLASLEALATVLCEAGPRRGRRQPTTARAVPPVPPAQTSV
ncbi:VWA domain-containing protein [Ideonella sp. DXS29W]|uniref:VWA domain-containing protein n=1 Tax=Ideonella lacteola TaxID=2984193 RepID=A0ABU9BU22_9BURK